jgi:hypothetical protein
MAKRHKPPIFDVAPIAGGVEPLLSVPASKSLLAKPPAPRGVKVPPPLFRPLKVYAFGPSRGRARGNVQSIAVRYEKLAPGPVGERISVVDYDITRDCYYDPVDLDDPHIAVNGGLDPSESDPHFHQQMAYAVVSESLRRIEVALGRTVRQRSPKGTKPLRVFIHPHYAHTMNAFSMQGRMMLGYFRAGSKARGRVSPGHTVFTCLSADVVGHETTHVVLWALRPDFDFTYLDNAALQEALADLTPLLFHFSNREIVLDTIQRTAGIIYRSQLDARETGAREPQILAELAPDNPLLALSGEFGDAIGSQGGIRNALLAPDPAAFASADDIYKRGAIVVAAIFDAMFSVYQRRTSDLFRIHRAGGGTIEGNDLPEPLAVRLSEEVERIATRFFGMCWRAIDYCPPIRTTLSDFLRACVTADYVYENDDTWGVRDALIQAFRARGITSTEVPFSSEEALRWPAADASWPVLSLDRSTEDAQRELRHFVDACGAKLGSKKGAAIFDCYPLNTARFASRDDLLQVILSTQIVTSKSAGVTVVFDGNGRTRHVIPTSKTRGAEAEERGAAPAANRGAPADANNDA